MQRIKSNTVLLHKITRAGFVGLFFGLVLIAWLISIAVSPFTKREELQKLVNADSLFTTKFDSTYYHPEMANRAKIKAFKEALLTLSENDSIQLIINLSDSTVNLSIKGVVIHQTKIKEFKKDRFLQDLPFIQEINLLSKPIPVISLYATIVKEPIVIRQAPKDTLEAALNAWEPDTLIQNPAFICFSIQHNFRVILEQDEIVGLNDKWKKFEFYKHLLYGKLQESLGNFIFFRKQEYQPTLCINMPVNDLRAVYRALPHNTYMVIKL